MVSSRQNRYRNSKQEKEQSTGQDQQWTGRTTSGISGKSRIKVQARVSYRQSEKVQEQQKQSGIIS